MYPSRVKEFVKRIANENPIKTQMNLFFEAYKPVQQDGVETVDKLSQRLLNAALLEDRRAAVLGLKGLAKDFKLHVGTNAMSTLVSILKNDILDTEIVTASLETLVILCKCDNIADPSDLGVMFTEIYIKDPRNVHLLVDILEESDFYVRFYIIELLNNLLKNKSIQLQDFGISRLIDLLDDTRDIIRNEGLLLLISLTHSNAEIQKIIAFENAFDRLLAIILAEGATDGGIVVEDCLHLVSNLLRHNASNQNFFRETSCIQKLARLLIKYDVNPDTSQVSEFPLTHESNNWTNSQKVTNIIYILELFRLLVVPNSPNTAVNQKVMHTCEILTQLVNLGLTTTIPAPVRGNTLLAIGDIIRGYKKLQDSFSNILHNKENKNGSTTRPALLVIVEASLSRDDFSVRRGATYVIQSFLYDNPDAQLYFSATFTPPPTDNPNSGNTENSHSAASLIVNALTDWDASSSRKDPFRVFFACAMISNIVNDNPKAKELTMNVFIGEGDEAVRLLHKMMYQLSSLTRESAGLDPRVSIAVLSFMSVWLYDFSLGIAEFFTEGSNLQFLVEQVIQSSGVDVNVQGMAAYLLGICYEFNDNSVPSFDKTNLQSLIISRIGVDNFTSRIDRMRESKHFQKADLHFEPVDSDKNPSTLVYFDYNVVELIKSTSGLFFLILDSLCKSATTVKKKKLPETTQVIEKAVVLEYENKIAYQDEVINELKNQVIKLKNQIVALDKSYKDQIASMEVNIASDVTEDSSTRLAELTREQEDLLICLAEQDVEVQSLKERLRTYGEDIPYDD